MQDGEDELESGSPIHEPTRILMLASDLATLEDVRPLAERLGCTLIGLRWPVHVSAAVDEHAPAILILSVASQATWALEVCANLRLVDPGHDLPVVILAGADEENAVERGLGAGADDVVRRGSNGSGELQARLGVQLRHRRHRDALRSLLSERDNLRIKATVDPLTQLLNRGALEEALLAELDRCLPFAVMFIDLDHFKRVNDTYGHPVGDAVLRAVGAQIKRSIRSNDIAGRYGGEEFVVGLAGCDETWAPTLAERHREWIGQITFPKENHPEQITASIGVAVFNPSLPDSSLSALLNRADTALYQAKRRGRNRVIVAPAPRRSVAEEKSATLARALVRSPMPVQSQAPVDGAEAIEAELVRQLNEGNAALPVIPALAMMALGMAQSPNVNMVGLAGLVEKDPCIAARLLAVANSPAYYRGFRVTSAREAIMRMGLSEAREILSSIAHSLALPKYNDILQRRSERAALAGRCAVVIARELRWSYTPAYTCGLLHDLGEARVLRILADLPTPAQGIRVVRELVQRYHARAGGQLAETWNLHSDIVQACALHHDEDQTESRPVKLATLSDLFANSVAPLRRGLNEEDVAAWHKFGLSDQQAGNILRALH